MNLTDRVREAGEIVFSEGRKCEQDELSDALVKSTLHTYQRYHYHNENSNWALVRRQGGLRVYSDRKAHGPSDTQKCMDDGTPLLTLMCSGFVRGSMKEIISCLEIDIDDDGSCLTKVRLVNDAFTDATVIKCFEQNKIESSVMSACLRWTYIKVGAPGISDRQMISYDRSGHILDEAGNQLTYQTIQTLSLPELPDRVRLQVPELYTQTCYLFRHFMDECVGVFTITEVQVTNKYLTPLLEYTISSYVHSASSYVMIARAKAYSALIESNTSVVPTRSDICSICSDTPSMFSRKLKPCKGCGRYTCRKCLHRRKIYSRTGLKVHSSLFCAVCVTTVERVDQEDLPSNHSGDTNTMDDSESASNGLSSPSLPTSWEPRNSTLSITSEDSDLGHGKATKERKKEDPERALERVLSSFWAQRDTDLSWNAEETEDFKADLSTPQEER